MTEDFIRASGYLTLGSRFKRIGERLQGDVSRLARSEGQDVPAAHLTIIAALELHAPITVGALAELLGIAQPGVTRSLALLQKAGLVKSGRLAGDQRQRSISLSAKGVDLAERTKNDFSVRIRSAVENLCRGLEGPLLGQLDQLEAELTRLPLDQRAAKPGKE